MSGFDDGGMAPPPPPPPSAGGGGAIPQRGLGDILTTAFELYRANAAKLIQIVAIVVIPLTFVPALIRHVAFKQNCDTGGDIQTVQQAQDVGEPVHREPPDGRCSSGPLPGSSPSPSSSCSLGAVTRGGVSARSGPSGGCRGELPVRVLAPRWPDRPRVADRARGVRWLLRLHHRGVIVAVFFAVAVPAFIIERLGATESMSRSWRLVSGHWWHTLGVFFVALDHRRHRECHLDRDRWSSTSSCSWIFSAIAQSITAPFVALVAVILYIDLRARHEGLTSDQLGSQLDAGSRR